MKDQILKMSLEEPSAKTATTATWPDPSGQKDTLFCAGPQDSFRRFRDKNYLCIFNALRRLSVIWRLDRLIGLC